MPATTRSDTPWRLTVESGPNAGAEVPLGPGLWRLGTAVENDIVLAEPAAAPHQAVLEIGPDGARLSGLAAGGQLAGRSLRPGATAAFRPGRDLALGATRLRLHGPRSPRRFAALLAPGAIAGGLLATWVGLAGASHGPPAGHPHAEAAPPPAVRMAAAPAAPSGEEAAAALTGRLREAGLAEAIAVTAAPGAVTLRGTMRPADAPAWQAAREWFDARFGGRVALLTEFNVAEAPAPAVLTVRLRAVALDPVPYFITASGERFMEGAELPGGWAVERILPRGVLLRHGDQRMELGL